LNDQQIAFLSNFGWWNRDVEWIKEHWKLWLDIEAFMVTCTEQEVSHEE